MFEVLTQTQFKVIYLLLFFTYRCPIYQTSVDTDKMYQDFIKDHNLSPLPHHSPVDTNLPEPRPWTFSRPMGKDSVGNTTYSYSHIDNILLPTALANTCKSSYTCDLGYLSDHVPLLAVVPTCGSLTL